MNITSRIAIPFLVSAFVFAPLLAVAQSTTTRGSDSSRYSDWRRQSNESQQKIDALGTVAEQNITMPILFGPVNNLNNYGELRISGRTHEGEDIMAPKGTPIVSPTAAVVTRVDYGAGEGNAIYTANPGGERFIYYHLDRVAEGIAAGQILARGDLIGYVGNTGDASGGAAHLHFEIRTSSGNTPSNPFPRLTIEFTPEEKMVFLSKILTQATDPNTLAQFLVANFRSTFNTAISRGATLPPLIAGLLLPPNANPANSGTTLALARNLFFGKVGEDVRSLQQSLNRNGFAVALSGNGSLGNETTYFGPATRAALIRFQEAHASEILAPLGLSKGTGIFGPATRAALALLRG